MRGLHPFAPPAQSRPVLQAGGALPPPGTLPRNLQPQGPCTPGGPPSPHHLLLLLRNSSTGANLDTPVPLTGHRVLGDVLGARCCVTQNKPPSLSGPRGVFLICIHPGRILQVSTQLCTCVLCSDIRQGSGTPALPVNL